jgi:hypothetical protein|tara:strand:- start:195 stop:386 length:192 start_codon:yes stop_codon:yes gene_type:complete
MFEFNFFNTGEFIKEKKNVIQIILPKIRKRLEELHTIENTFEIQTEIENKELLIKCLKYYYSI